MLSRSGLWCHWGETKVSKQQNLLRNIECEYKFALNPAYVAGFVREFCEKFNEVIALRYQTLPLCFTNCHQLGEFVADPNTACKESLQNEYFDTAEDLLFANYMSGLRLRRSSKGTGVEQTLKCKGRENTGSAHTHKELNVHVDHELELPDLTLFPAEELPEGMLDLVREHPLQRIPENKTGLCHEICSYLRRILQENDNFFQKQIIGNYLEILFYEGCNLMLHDPKNGAFLKRKPGSKKNRIADRFLLAVEKGIRSSRQVEYYAEELGMSAKYLYAVVKEVTGKTPSEWINEYTLTEARIMLKNTDSSIQNISYDLGFATPSHFGKFFREQTGTTPKEFRKTARGGEKSNGFHKRMTTTCK